MFHHIQSFFLEPPVLYVVIGLAVVFCMIVITTLFVAFITWVSLAVCAAVLAYHCIQKRNAYQMSENVLPKTDTLNDLFDKATTLKEIEDLYLTHGDYFHVDQTSSGPRERIR